MINGNQHTGHTLPNDRQAEQSILGLTMTRGHIPDAAKDLQAADFYQPTHETIWAACQQLTEQEKPCTFIGVRAHLQERGQLDSRGGVPSQTIVELTSTPAFEDPAHLTEIIQDRSLRRQIITLHERALQHAYNSPDPAHTQLDYIQKQFLTVTTRHHPETQLLKGVRTADWLAAQVFPPLKWVVPALLPEGMSLLIGAPKIGKSWLSLSIALAVGHGGYALGKIHVGHPRPVLLLALEDSHRRLQSRIQKLLEGDSFPPHLHYLTDLKPDQLIPTIKAWLDQQPDNSAPLVILDTLGKVMPPTLPNESQYQRDYRISGDLKRLCDRHHPGTALLVLHHDRKTVTDDFVDSVSGTNGIAGAADTIMVIQRPRNETTGLLKITGRDVEEAEYAIEITDGNWALVGDDLAAAAKEAVTVHATANLGDRSADIIRFVNSRPDDVRAGDVADELGLTPKEARTYLARLFDAGRLKKAGRGAYTSVATVVSVVSEEPTQTLEPTKTTQTTHATGGTASVRARDTTPQPPWQAPKVIRTDSYDRTAPCPTCGKSFNDPTDNPACIEDHYEGD